jgi:polar amino acid transport system substrate-binding protein
MGLENRRAFILIFICLATSLAVAGCGSSSSSSKATSTPSSATKSLGLISPGTFTVGSDTTYPPMESKNPSNPSQAVGADVDLANALAKAMGLSGAKIVSAPFDTIITSLNDKRFDVVMSSMNHTPERAKRVDFIDYMTASQGILVPKTSTVHAANFHALCGKTVSVERGTTELDGLIAANKTCSPKIRILSFTADTDAFQALASGHSEAYTGDFPVVRNYASDPRFGGKYRAAGPAFATGANYGIAIRKGDSALKIAIQKALATIRSNGHYIKILKKWGVSDAALK